MHEKLFNINQIKTKTMAKTSREFIRTSLNLGLDHRLRN